MAAQFLQVNRGASGSSPVVHRGIDGTPGWVIGDRVIDGAVGFAALGDAVAEARRS